MKNRRGLLKALSVASTTGAIENWKKPLVKAVALPAHAQISCQLCFFVQATITGLWIGNREMLIADQFCSQPLIFEQMEDWSAGVFEDQFCANLEPGTYTIDFGAGAGDPDISSAGSVDISAQLDWCGNVLWSDSDSEESPPSGGGGTGIGNCGTLTIAPDGTCSFDDSGSCCFNT